MAELNFGRLLRRTRMYALDVAVKDLGTGHEATYAEHVERVARLSAAIASLGVGPTDRLAVLAGSSHVYVELWHACLAGAAVINPLNQRLSPDELVYILEDSSSEVIFVDADFAPVVEGIRGRLPTLRSVVLIGDGDVDCDVRLDDLLEATPAAALPPEPADDAPAVLMYTGGTTGLPKGVVLSQQAIVLSIYRMQSVVDVGLTQHYLAFMPMFHIGGIASWGLYLPCGGRVVILPGFEPGAVNSAVRDEGITSIGAVPTMLAFMLAHPEFEASMLSSLELVMYGAAPMPPPLLERLMELYPHIAFHQAYGMTEICAIGTGLTRADHVRGGDILTSVGRPMLGVDLEIRDPETCEATPQGEVGEIWLRADSIMTEYWNKPDQTAASLVDGWYRSGDAARLDERGYVFLADRVKDMIVTGGENVYSLEVENAISPHPAVSQVAVVGVPDPTWGERVHAVVVCEPGSVTVEELEEMARAKIAGFKVPKSWTLQAEPLPLSAAGKVLKRDLRDRLNDPT
jgi:long-chain acyl-CoA synthetase